MRQGAHLARHLVRGALLLVLAAAPLQGEELPEIVLDPAGTDAEAPAAGEERHVETLEQKGGSVGYRVVSRDGNPARALPYGFLHSSAAGSLFYRRMDSDTNMEVEGAFLNENDYAGDLLLDYRGDYRLHLRTESLYHNLDRELLFSPSFLADSNDPVPRLDPVTGTVAPNRARYRSVQDPEQPYGLSVTQDLAQFRYRLHNFPLHANLGYWRLVREGTIQDRFADASFEGTGGALSGDAENVVLALPRRIERRTDEASLGLDAHLGPVDLVYSFKARQFEERSPLATYDYLPRTGLDGVTVERLGGVQQRGAEPDSRLFSHTVKAHTSLAGGVVATGSYTIEQRENRSRLSDTAGARHRRVDLHGGAGDFTYAPCKEFSLALKYRRQELDYEGPPTVTNLFFAPPASPARSGIDSTKDRVSATLSFRLTPTATLNAEYRGDYLSREGVTATPTAASFALPEHVATQRGTVSLLYRPRKGARLSARYSYATTDHPSYGASFAERHEGELLASYASGSRFGASAALRERRDSNDRVERFLINYPLTTIGYAEVPSLARSRETCSANLSFWAAPAQRTTVSAFYSYLEDGVDQGVFFTGVGIGSEAPANYFSRSHVYGVNGTWALRQDLDLQLTLQQVRSKSAFRPAAASFSAVSDTAGVRELTEQDATISTASARAERRFGEHVSGSVEYSFNDYDEAKASYGTYGGTVHAVAAYLSARW